MSTTEENTGAPEVPVDPNAVSITVNGRQVTARKGEMIIAATDREGEYVPRFCYHPRMSPVGMCRQCMVEVEGPRGPMMVVSCMTPVADGQVVRTDTEQVKRAQEGMIELLLANHPLDCPVCDKGGECPLQDQAFSHGPGESRFVEEKRHYEKPIPISDLVFLDRERCILCDRCTRFAREVAGDPLISFTQRGNNTQVMTFPDEPFSSYFSGNTVQICPVGALTAQPYRFKARPWDLEQRESTCTTCSVGCRVVVQSSRDELVRYQGVDIDPVNWGWLCDRGRFDFQSVNSPDRLVKPLVRRDGVLVETSWSEALDTVARAMREAGSATAVLGGARGTNEDAFMWARLATALGSTMTDAQLDDGLPASVYSRAQATIDSACASSTIVLLAPDLKEELPVLHLRLRDAATRLGARIIEVSTHESGLTAHAWRSVRCEPGAQVDAVRALLDDAAVRAQLGAGTVTVVVGRANLAESAAHTMAAVDAVTAAVPSAAVLPVLRRGNVRGALSVGLAPRGANDAAAILGAAANGKVGCLVLLGADPMSDVPDAGLARRALSGARTVVAVDTFLTASAQHADVVLPAAAFAEKEGTTTNLEGRVSNVVQKITPRGTSRADWMIAAELMRLLGHDSGVTTLDGVQQLMNGSLGEFGAAVVSPENRRSGVLAPVAPATGEVAPAPSVAPRSSYDFRLVLARKLYDAAMGTATSPSLAGLAPGASVTVNPLDAERIGTSDGRTVTVTSGSGSVALTVVTSQAVPRGTALVPFNQPGPDVRQLVSADSPVTDVRIEAK